MIFEKFLKRKLVDEPRAVQTGPLSGSHVAILAADGFEQSELFEPKSALEAAGARVSVVSLGPGRIKGWNKGRWGKSIKVNYTVREAFHVDFDSLMLPGGVLNPDSLRESEMAISFVRTFVNNRRPIAAICHGPQTLIETGMVKGRRLTSYPSIRTDLINAGAEWVDKEAVVSYGLITSRRPDDIPAFNRMMIEEFSNHRPRTSLPDTEGYVVTL